MTDEQILRAFLAGVAPHDLIAADLVSAGFRPTDELVADRSVAFADAILERVTRDTVRTPPMPEDADKSANLGGFGESQVYPADEHLSGPGQSSTGSSG